MKSTVKNARDELQITDIFGTPFTLVDKRSETENSLSELFLIKPYLQLGRGFNDAPSLVLFFHSKKKGKDWLVQVRNQGESDWRDARLLRVAFKIAGGKKHFRYRAELTGLAPGAAFEYRVAKAWTLVFSSQARMPAAEKSRIAIFGDFGDGEAGSISIGKAVLGTSPDLVVAAGDIVYDQGLVSEYLKHFFPVYNSEELPLLRQVPMAPCFGNHDIGTPRQVESPDYDDIDALGCFKFFETPTSYLALKKKQLKEGLSRRRARFIDVLPKGFLSRANYSFSYGPVFFLVLDANIYMDWTKPTLQDWVTRQLDGAPAGSWKVVVFHQAAFNADYKYKDDQHMRVLCPVFEAGGVHMVFSGHCHYFERSHPLSYELANGKVEEDGQVLGKLKLVQTGSGVSGTVQSFGVTYVITGAGGKLVSPEHWPGVAAHTAVLDLSRNSFSLIEADCEKLVFLQLDADGKEIDRFEIGAGSAASQVA